MHLTRAAFSLIVPILPIVCSNAQVFNRIATFNVCTQLDPTCNVDNVTVAEIVDATPDGMTLVYTDSESQNVGFVDITDPAAPIAAGTVPVDGEPTSVSVTPDGLYAVAAINSSPNFVNTSGFLAVISISSKTIVHQIDIGGQPDSVKVSEDNNYICVAVENERDEDLGEGRNPQMPPGYVVVIDKSSTEDPTMWNTTFVNMSGLDGLLYPEDPEPEFVDINSQNQCIVTLQENNGVAIIDLATATVIKSYSLGMVNLTMIDATEDSVINQKDSLDEVPRESDGVAWIGDDFFATADEGDLDGGSRGFTIFSASNGSVLYSAASSMEHIAARYGNYPELRSESRGIEAENCEYAVFGDENILVINTERASLVYIYSILDPSDPTQVVFKQALPATARPEGAKAIPGRNLLVVASESDSREDKIRGSISIYQYQNASQPSYPTLISANRTDGTPIPFSALSGLAASSDGMTLYAIEDSFFKKTRILTIDVSSYPYMVTAEMHITDSSGILAAKWPDLVNDDSTVNIDGEGISLAEDGGFYVVNEGNGTVGDPEHPVGSNNFILKLSNDGMIEEYIGLPDELNDIQLRYGFEGVAQDGNFLVVIFQREWGNETDPRVGIYNLETKEWKFVLYNLEMPTSQNGGWVGLSDISKIGGGQFLVAERDDQAGPDAAIKQLVLIDLGDYGMPDMSTLDKTVVRDLIPDLLESGGNVVEKIEGCAVFTNGTVCFVNDNDGVEDNSGEQHLICFPQKFEIPEDDESTGSDNSTDQSTAIVRLKCLLSIISVVVTMLHLLM